MLHLGEKGRAERAVLLELEEHAAPAIDSWRLLTPAREERAEDRRVVDASRLRGDLTSREAQQPRVRIAGVAEDRRRVGVHTAPRLPAESGALTRLYLRPDKE